MTSKPVDISNLGIDAHRQYALNALGQKDLHLLQDLETVRGKMDVSVVSPARPLDTKFEVGYQTIWALFDRPADFLTGASNLFTHLLLPSLGGSDLLSEKLDQIGVAAKPEPTVQKLLQQQFADEETYRLIQGRLRQFAKG